ncbi:hypothetical protein GPECTOR_78g92 [Gonium pectorale]|uniref:Uncharacterized protein n=1 Tax=Gonium pectorale TaxID=33097 RepID=A0A150G262_GONPE|nr:hypothetical protein GPECTOR_78g92 [Gonium pectorale]|eukprot:KXZ43904.1 hypothetical protein GPECTOR_78g92 [Gonium pectorale]
MAPKGGKAQRKAATAPSPLALYKRALTAIRNWSPLASAASDTEALTALAECCLRLQSKLGLAVPAPEPQAGEAAAAATNGTNGAASGGSGGCDDELAAVWPVLAALDPGMDRYTAIVRHSLDLDLDDWEDEPGFLLASAHLELGASMRAALVAAVGAEPGKLLGRMWPRREAASLRHLAAARGLFPDFVAARVASAQVWALLARAHSQEDLHTAEQLLAAALATAERLAGSSAAAAATGGDGDGAEECDAAPWALAEANAACRREAEEAGPAARRSLAMLLCQEGRHGDAAPLLAAMDFSFRLARRVLHYPLDPMLGGPSSASSASVSTASAAAAAGAPPEASDDDSGRYVRAVDGALPGRLLHVLRGALAPGSRFWSEHGYGRPFPAPSGSSSGTGSRSGFGSGSPDGPGRYTWMADLPPHPDGPDGWGPTDPRDAAPTPLDRVWERLDGTPAPPGAVQYDACFQGF